MESKNYLFQIVLVLICFFPLAIKAQLVTNNIHPFYSLTQGFLGPDYYIWNIQYTGNLNAVGQFDGTATNLGLTNGIIMTTGTVFGNENGPHGPNNKANAGIDISMPGYSLLNSLAGNDTYDAAVLEFNVIPSVDSISINYVFASEEYMEYVASSFNDAFAIYISGPGIMGNEIISRLLNGQTVTINNVNNGSQNSGPCNNCINYVFNGTGTIFPYNFSNEYIQYDGFTTGLRARKTGLQIGQSYHITIAIADAGDGILDSGVFLESCNSCNFQVGIDEEKSDVFTIYPNPSNGIINIEWNGTTAGTIQFFDLTGKEVKSLTLSADSNLNISDLGSGVYMVLINDGVNRYQRKITLY